MIKEFKDLWKIVLITLTVVVILSFGTVPIEIADSYSVAMNKLLHITLFYLILKKGFKFKTSSTIALVIVFEIATFVSYIVASYFFSRFIFPLIFILIVSIVNKNKKNILGRTTETIFFACVVAIAQLLIIFIRGLDINMSSFDVSSFINIDIVSLALIMSIIPGGEKDENRRNIREFMASLVAIQPKLRVRLDAKEAKKEIEAITLKEFILDLKHVLISRFLMAFQMFVVLTFTILIADGISGLVLVIGFLVSGLFVKDKFHFGVEHEDETDAWKDDLLAYATCTVVTMLAVFIFVAALHYFPFPEYSILISIVVAFLLTLLLKFIQDSKKEKEDLKNEINELKNKYGFEVVFGMKPEPIYEIGKIKNLTDDEMLWLDLYYSQEMTYLETMTKSKFEANYIRNSESTFKRRVARAKKRIES